MKPNNIHSCNYGGSDAEVTKSWLYFDKRCHMQYKQDGCRKRRSSI